MGAKFYNAETLALYRSAGIDPAAILGSRIVNAIDRSGLDNDHIVRDIRLQLEVVDRQDALNRATAYNLYPGLDWEMMARILYYRYKFILFKWEEKFYTLPFALVGNIDPYGRYIEVTPHIFAGAGEDESAPWIKGLTFEVRHEAPLLEDFKGKSAEEIKRWIDRSCVIFTDYSHGLSQNGIPRVQLNDPILTEMATMIPYARTALMNSTGITGLPIASQDEQPAVEQANKALRNAALKGEAFVGVERSITENKLGTITGGAVAKAEEYFQAMQSLDNYRLSLYGLDNGGVFQKKAHELQAEQELSGGSVRLVMEDSIRGWQKSCVIANTIWGGSMWITPSEASMGMDRDGDAVMGDDGPDSNAQKQEVTNDE